MCVNRAPDQKYFIDLSADIAIFYLLNSSLRFNHPLLEGRHCIKQTAITSGIEGSPFERHSENAFRYIVFSLDRQQQIVYRIFTINSNTELLK